MREPSVIRTLAVPLVVAILFLVLTPKLCGRAVIRARQNQPAPAEAVPGSAPRSGLIITSSPPAPAARPKVPFPPGLDAQRIQYLVEIDPTFATPKTMTATPDSPITKVLLDRHYVDASLAPTGEGIMNVSGAVNSPSGWVVPIAARKFMSIDGLDDAGEGRFNAVVRWRWEPNALGIALLQRPADHFLTAEFAGGQRNWTLTRFIQEPDQEFP